MAKSDINELLVKYLTGETNDIEDRRLNEWRSGSEKNEVVFQTLEKIWNENLSTPEIINSEDLIDKIWNTSQEKETLNITKQYSWNYLLKVAASILIVISVSFGIYQIINQTDDIAENVVPSNIIKENPAGQKIKMYLPDGTIVWLNSSSKLRYDQSYNQSERVVKLEGEAFFEVVEDKNRPFVVVSGDVRTTALGTSFNVKAYPEDKKIGISLVSGKVKVENTSNDQKEGVILLPGYELIHNVVSNQHYERTFDQIEVVGWKEGILSFKGADYHEMVKKLERWYGVDIKTKGTPPDDWSLTTFYKEETLVNILKNLRFGKEFDYELEKDLLLIKFH